MILYKLKGPKKFLILLILGSLSFFRYDHASAETWQKYANNPVLSNGTTYDWDGKDVYDVSVLYVNGKYRMWYSGREGSHNSAVEFFIGILRLLQRYKKLHNRIGYAESFDGTHWVRYSNNPVLDIGKDGNWDDENVDRPSVIYKNGAYHMWFTGWNRNGFSMVGYALSIDGIHWKKLENPVLVPADKWEKTNLMCPNVIYDKEENLFKMWYSGGDAREPDNIGYAVSSDGINWLKYSKFPIFTPEAKHWDSKKIGSFQVIKIDYTYYAFYNAFDVKMNSRIGSAKSLNGINGWVRYPKNPIIKPGEGFAWDCSNVYKPTVIFHGGKLQMFYNAANKNRKEQIGLASTAMIVW